MTIVDYVDEILIDGRDLKGFSSLGSLVNEFVEEGLRLLA